MVRTLRVARNVQTWTEQEGTDDEFCDLRLGRRCREILKQITAAGEPSIPFACQDAAQTKAAYRFFSNPRVNEKAILSGDMRCTRDRVQAVPGIVLVLHDTTQISYGSNADDIGLLSRVARQTICGISMHSSLVITPQGLPLGIAAIKFWTRKQFKGAHALSRTVNATRIPIEHKESIRWLQNLQQASVLLECPERCVHIGDRESDIYELFCAAEKEGTHFLVRTCADRLCDDGVYTVAQKMRTVRSKGVHKVEFRDKHGRVCHAKLALTFRRLRLLPSRAKRSRYPELMVTIIHAQEKEAPSGRDPIDWKLITDLPVQTRTEAIEKLCWYALRWKIEVFHYILKSGCRIEQSKLRTAQRRVNLIALCCIVSWRIFWLTMVHRSALTTPPSVAFTADERRVLRTLFQHGRSPLSPQSCLTDYLICLARLGGYLARAHDPSPGNLVVWRGMRRLDDLVLGSQIAKRCG